MCLEMDNISKKSKFDLFPYMRIVKIHKKIQQK